MYTANTTICNKTGLHARPAAQFIKRASGYQADISIKNLKTGKSSNAKSMIMVLRLALSEGTPVEICAQGEDETAAVTELIDLIDNGVGE